MLLHNKLPTKERLFRIGMHNDPYCQFCVNAVVSDTEHFFCSCDRVADVWDWVRRKLTNMVGNLYSDWDLLNFMWSKCSYDKEAVWLLGSYIWKIWFKNSPRPINKEEMFGYLTFKFKADQLGARHKLSSILALD